MKIICLIRNKPPLVYFINSINARYPVSLVIIEAPVSNVKINVVVRLYRKAMNILHNIRRGRENADLLTIYDRFFGNKWRSLDKNIPVMTVPSINDPSVLDCLLSEEPDIILDHGTSIVKDSIIRTAPTTLNIHWGLSPYYRGSNCTNWALLKHDPYNIGVTVHSLAKEVDGGDIFSQKRIIPEAADTVRSINMKLTKAGTEIVIHALDILSRGESLKFFHQDLSIGLLTRLKDYTEAHAREIVEIEKNGLSSMLASPSRSEKLPIYEQ